MAPLEPLARINRKRSPGLADLFVKRQFFSLRRGVPRLIRKITSFLDLSQPGERLRAPRVAAWDLSKVDESV